MQTGASRRSVALELIHSDLHGPLPPANGIERQHITRATQNGVAERTNRILDEGVTSLLPARFWGEALSCFLHTLNLPLLSKAKHPMKPSIIENRPSPTSVSSAAGPMPMCRRTSATPSSPSPGSVSSLVILSITSWKCWDVFISRGDRNAWCRTRITRS